MKTLFAILLLSFPFTSSAQACPDFSGRYERAVVTDHFNPKLVITQKGCEIITINYDFGHGDLYTRVILVDGQKHTSFVKETGTTMSESYTWNDKGQVLVDGEYHNQNDVNFGKGIIQYEDNIGIFSEETDYVAGGCTLELCKAHESSRYRMVQ